MVFKNRKGETMIELLVASALFFMFISSLMVIPNFVRVSSQETTQNIANIANILNVSSIVADEWDSASRMEPVDAPSFNPNAVNSVGIKKSYFPLSGNYISTWASFTINGNDLKRNDASLFPLGSRGLFTTIDGSRYYALILKTIDGQTVATNYGGVPVISAYTDKSTTWWSVTLVFKYKDYPIVISGLRQVSPISTNPKPVSYTSPYQFDQAMDTGKYGTWTNEFMTTTLPTNVMSNYLGYPAMKATQIRGPDGSPSSLPLLLSGIVSASLYDPVANVPIQGKTVYCFNKLTQTTSSAVTDSNGKIMFPGLSSSYKLVFLQDADQSTVVYETNP